MTFTEEAKKDVQSINFEELENVAGGASYDKLPASEVASFRKTLAYYKREGATKEQMIKIYREEAPTWGASKEQIEIVVDLINDSWDSL